MLGDGLIDDGDFETGGGVVGSDGAPGDEGDACGFKVLAGDPVEGRDHVLFWRGSVAAELNGGTPGALTDGWCGGECGGLNAGNRGEPFDEALMESGSLAGFVAGEFGIEVSEQEMSAVEAEVLVLQIAKRAEEEAGTYEQKQR